MSVSPVNDEEPELIRSAREHLHLRVESFGNAVRFPPQNYLSMEELQADLDVWIVTYNNDRTH